jgi:peptide/nickel transport system permease protein
LPVSAPIGVKAALIEAVRTKSGLVAVTMLAFLLLLAILVPIFAPYNVVQAWADPTNWANNPRYAAPEWTQFFLGKDLSKTTIFPANGQPGGFDKVRVPVSSGGQNYTFMVLKKTFAYQYDDFPSEVMLYVNTTFGRASQYVQGYWERPDGTSILLFDHVPAAAENNTPTTYAIANYVPFWNQGSSAIPDQTISNLDKWLVSNNITTSQEQQAIVNGSLSLRPQELLFAKLNHAMLDPHAAQVLKGNNYTLRIVITGFSSIDDANARAIIYGTVFGLAGTDDARHDLLIGLMWGAPVALAFGLAGGLASVLIQMILGAIGGWYGGVVDELVQRSADFYLIIPTLPILILVGLLYRPQIVFILLILIVLGLVGATTKVVRSIVLQVREEQYIEAARSYGASRTRILFRYILPRVMPYTFALIALTVPAFIFLEASLSFLGLGDPILPTWGSTLGRAFDDDALVYGRWWWIVAPIAGIVFTAVAFSLLGYAFDKVLNPRLREQ